MSDDLVHVMHALNEARRRFVDAKGRLHALLPHVSGPHDIANYLLSHAEEFGVQHTLDRVRQHPSEFDLEAAPPGLAEPLSDTLAATESMDRLVAERNALLERTEPGRPRAYMNQGREFTIDLAAHRMVWTDTQGTEPLPAGLRDVVRQRRRQRDR